MHFTWGPAKRERTLRERGVDFVDAPRLWDGPVLERTDSRQDYGEVRIRAVGLIAGRGMMVVYTDRVEGGQPVRRVISMRRINEREQQAYDAAYPR